MKTPENILIIRTDRIGDVVLTIPMAKVLKEKFPSCRITFLVKEYTAPLLKDNKYIDEVIILKEAGGIGFISENRRLVKSKKFDTCFVVSPSLKITLIPFLSGIKQRIGTGYRWYSFLLNKKVFEHRKHALKNELEYNVGQLKFFVDNPAVEKSPESFGIKINYEALNKVKKILVDEKIDLTKPFILIHPGSGGSAVDWPVHRFCELAELIKKNLDAQLIVTGSKNEFEICSKISSVGGAVNLAGKFNLAELTALISLCSVFIANSTGPLHIAAALGRHVIGFYPKIVVASPQRWGPYTTSAYIFQPEIDCSNCSREQCLKLNCMDSISAFNVFFTIRKIYMLPLKNGENNV